MENVTSGEMKLYLAQVYIRVVCRPYLWSYYKIDPVVKFIAKSIGMLCDRFVTILTVLHANKWKPYSQGQPHCDPLFKICPILNKLTDRFHEVYKPEKIMRPFGHFKGTYIVQYIWKESPIYMA
jgi:hypothetical protein